MVSGHSVPADRPRVRVGRVAFVVLLVLVFLVAVWWRGAVNSQYAKGLASRHYSMVLGYLEEFDPDPALERKVMDDASEFQEVLGSALRRSNTQIDIMLLGIVALLLVERITAVRRLRVSGSGRAPGGE